MVFTCAIRSTYIYGGCFNRAQRRITRGGYSRRHVHVCVIIVTRWLTDTSTRNIFTVYCSAFMDRIIVGARFNGCRDCTSTRCWARNFTSRFDKLLNSIGLTIVRTRLGLDTKTTLCSIKVWSIMVCGHIGNRSRPDQT